MLPVALALVGALAPAPMAGPFPSIENACRALRYESYPTSSGIAEPPIVCRKQPLRSADGAAPYRTVAALERRFENGRDARVVHLAVRTDAGWFVARRGVAVEGSGRCEGQITIDELAARPLVDGEPARAVLRLRARTSCSGALGNDGEYESRWEERYWLIGGVGPSGQPSATPPIVVEQHRRVKETRYTSDGKPVVKRDDAVRALRFQPGALVVDASSPTPFRDDGGGETSVRPAVGIHPLVFR